MKTLGLRFALIAMLLALPMTAVSQEKFLGDEANRAILSLQQKANSDFAKGEYGQALEVYQKELAPLGDKYSQYMVGYMYLAGKGVQEDAILASAWYRLAAQRGTEEYVRIRDSLLALCNDEQRARSDQIYIILRREMGDLTLVERLIWADLQILRRSTSSTLFLQGAVQRTNSRQRLNEMDAAAERIISRVEMLSRRIELETTLAGSERETLTKLFSDAQREVDDYNARR
jgi:TPR repeat protein